jgi:hypothetical protein
MAVAGATVAPEALASTEQARPAAPQPAITHEALDPEDAGRTDP